MFAYWAKLWICWTGRFSRRVIQRPAARRIRIFAEAEEVDRRETSSTARGRAVHISVVAAERQAMIEKLSTPEGRKLYSLRQQTVEPTFGNIKAKMGLSRFVLDGQAGAQSETWLICIAHNLKIYARRRARLRRVARALSCALVWIMGIAGVLVRTKGRHDALLAAKASA